MFHAWHRVRDGTCPMQFRVLMRPIRCQVARLLKAGETCGVTKTEGVCREVLKVYDAVDVRAGRRGGAHRQYASAPSAQASCGAKGALGPRVPTGRGLWKP